MTVRETTVCCSLCNDTGRYCVAPWPGGLPIKFDDPDIPFCPACGREAAAINYHLDTTAPKPVPSWFVILLALGVLFVCAVMGFGLVIGALELVGIHAHP